VEILMNKFNDNPALFGTNVQLSLSKGIRLYVFNETFNMLRFFQIKHLIFRYLGVDLLLRQS